MRIVDFIDPRTELNTWQNFKELTTKQKAITLLVSAVAAVIFLGYGGFVAFRALVHHFSKIKPPLNRQSQEVNDASQPLLQPERPIRLTNTDISTMTVWKQIMYRGLQKGLAPQRLTHGFAEESGDCFFDSVAQVLNKIQPGQHHTKQSVRQRLEQQLRDCPDQRYEDLLRGNVDGHSYEDFCDNIHRCAEDFQDGGAPIWGDRTCLQLVADAYRVKIVTHSTMMFELSLLDSMDHEWDDFEKFQYNRGDDEIVVEVPTLVDSSEISPTEGAVRGTIHLGNMTRNVWGHFVPVFPRH